MTIQKPWGYEILFAHTNYYVGKVIYIRRDHRLSLQYHQEKDETIYLYSGEAEILLEDANGSMTPRVLTAGSAVRIPAGAKHRLHAIKDCVIFEVSTPQIKDVVRIEDDYGRATNT